PHPGHGNPVRLWNIHVSGRGILPILRYEISVFAGVIIKAAAIMPQQMIRITRCGAKSAFNQRPL
ncbi:unnamed protein product, partial [marine sediment metagenome]